MRTIERSPDFKRDFKRESRDQHRATLDAELAPIFVLLANDRPLEPWHFDHELSGDWGSYRECHVKPGLLLIYQIHDEGSVRLVRLGSFGELFG